MIKTMLLICSVGTPADQCTPDTALDVMVFPPTRTLICGLPQQATLARTALVPEPGKSYPKVVCTRMVDEARR